MTNIDQLIKDINKKFKSTIATEGLNFDKVPRIPFSSPRLNYMTYGGIPTRRITEFSGAESSGKTTSALDLVKNSQKIFPERRVVYVDCEHTIDEPWARLLGVDVEKLILVQPDTETAEQIFDIILGFVCTGDVSLIVLDSIGVLVSAQAYAKTIEEKTYGGISGPLTTFSNKLVPLLSKYDCTFVGINQMRDAMNSSYGETKTTGGHAWKHMCTMRIEFRKSDFIDIDGKSVSRSTENPAGNLVKCHLNKSKVCRQDRKIGFFTLNYLEGIDFILDTIEVGVKFGIIAVAGAWYTLIDPETAEILVDEEDKPLRFQGKQKLKEFLRINDNILEEITNKIDSMVS